MSASRSIAKPRSNKVRAATRGASARIKKECNEELPFHVKTLIDSVRHKEAQRLTVTRDDRIHSSGILTMMMPQAKAVIFLWPVQ